MAFSTWSALKKEILDAIASGIWRAKSFEADGFHKEFHNIADLIKWLEWVENRAAEEEAGAGGIPLRTNARAGDR